MDEPANTTDSVYESSVREAERSFLAASITWMESALEEWERIKPEFPNDLNVALNGVLAPIANALFRIGPDETIIAEQGTTLAEMYAEELLRLKCQLKWELPHKLADLCRDFAMAELRAYAALSERLGVLPSRAIAWAEKHAEATLAEVRERKWKRCMYKISNLFDVRPWIEEEWAIVERDVRLFVHDTLSTEIWFHEELSRDVSGFVVLPTRAVAIETHAEVVPAAMSEPPTPRELRDSYLALFPEKVMILDVCWAAKQRYREWTRWIAGALKEGSKPDMAFRAVLRSGLRPEQYRPGDVRTRGWK